MKNLKSWLGPLGVLLLFVLVSLAAVALIRPEGANRWMLLAGVWLLGVIAAGLVFVVLRIRAKRNAGPGGVEGGGKGD
jgi:hypothetical protein